MKPGILGIADAAQDAEKLRRVRDELRRLYGDKYEERLREPRELLRRYAAELGQPVLEIATHAATAAERDGRSGIAWSFLAAAVDLIEEPAEPPKERP